MKLLVRADAGATIGIGHVMRCLALAQAWQDAGGDVLFLSNELPEGLRRRLAAEGVELVDLRIPDGDAAETADLARRIGASWIVVDGYQFSSAYQSALKAAGHRLLWVDDLAAATPYTADLVLNQNEDADAAKYSNRDSATELLLGTRFVMLRREFGRWLEWNREARASKNVLVTMGGADEANVTAKVVEALRELAASGVEARVVVGGNDRTPAAGMTHVRVENEVTDMPALMAWADIAVTAGGSTCWELAFMQLPFVVVAVAPNQISTVERVDEAGIGLGLGWHSEVTASNFAAAIVGLLEDPDRRRTMSVRGRELVDGRGARRVVDRMIEKGRR